MVTSWIFLWQCRCDARSSGRNDRRDEPSPRVPGVRTLLAPWGRYRVRKPSGIALVPRQLKVIRPLIGGTFSDPAEKFGLWFNSDLFRTFPYLLPCLIVAVLTLLTVCLGNVLLQEVRRCQFICIHRTDLIAF